MGIRIGSKKPASSRVIVIDWAWQPALVGIAVDDRDRLRLEQMGRLGSIEISQTAGEDAVLGLIGRGEVVMRRLRIPHLPSNELAGVVQSEAVRQFDFDEHHAIIDHVVTDGFPTASVAPTADESGSDQQVDLAMLSRKVASRCESMVSPDGVSFQRLGLRPYATWNAMLRAGGEPQVVTLLVADAGKTIEMTVGIGRHVLLSNVVSNNGLVGPIRRMIADFGNRFPQLDVERIVLAGELSDTESLATELAIKVDAFDPLEAIESGPDLRCHLQSENISLSATVGIIGALNASADQWPIDFVNPKRTTIRSFPSRNRLKIAAALLAVVLVVVLITTRLFIAQERSRIDQLISQRAQLDARLHDSEQILQQFHTVNLACTQRGNCLVELQRLSEAVSDKRQVHATSVALEFDKHASDECQIIVTGFAADHQAISRLQQSLDGQPIGPVRGTKRHGDDYFDFESRIPVTTAGGTP